MKGLFITVEGMDGSGKSTQIRFLREYLQSLGYEPVVTREPGGCPFSETLRGADPLPRVCAFPHGRAVFVRGGPRPARE